MIRIAQSALSLALALALASTSRTTAAPHPEGPYDKLPSDGCLRCHTCAKPTPDVPCLLTCTRAAETPSRVEDGPDIVILDQLVEFYLPVPFDHKGHARMAEMTHRCATCHHFTPPGTPHPACRTCHDLKSAGTDIAKPGLKGAYHRQCLNCHKEWTDEKDCVKCHAPKTGTPLDALAATVTKDDLLGRMHPPIPEPDTEIYRADARNAAGKLVIFRHREHIHRFGLACVECHHEDNCQRCHSAGNGHQQQQRTLAEHHKPCLVCHAVDMDESRADQSRCKRCHWSPDEPRPKSFDHADTGWPLSRYHAEKSCRACHKTVPFAKPERGCAACHGTWAPGRFDHAVTGQTLDETHASVDCADCHAGGDYAAKPTCGECHDSGEVSFPAKRPGPTTPQ